MAIFELNFVERIYVKETGDEAPFNEISYHEWHERYVKWLEKRIENIEKNTVQLLLEYPNGKIEKYDAILTESQTKPKSKE